jgi:hypothetical protein
VPDDRIEVIETDLATDHTDICMEGKDQMPAKSAPRDTDIANDTNESSSRNKNPERMQPHFSEFPEEGLVILDVSHLVWILVVPLEIPIRWRSDYEMHRFIGDKREVPGICVDEFVSGFYHMSHTNRDT